MSAQHAPYHAHIYYELEQRASAERLHQQFSTTERAGAVNVLFVGAMRDMNMGPHPKPQFEIHFRDDALAALLEVIETSGFTALVHPLTDDDLADHTSLAIWVGEPLALNLSVLDPPGMNQGIARFGKSDF
jgi:aromatic ring-cleaving dioxygenase